MENATTSISPDLKKDGFSGNLRSRDLSSSSFPITGSNRAGKGQNVKVPAAYRRNVHQFPLDNTNDHIQGVKAARLRILKEREEILRQEAPGGEDSGLGSCGSSEGEDSETMSLPPGLLLRRGWDLRRPTPTMIRPRGEEKTILHSPEQKTSKGGRGLLSP